MKKYSVVEFSDGLALVPSVWLKNDKCIYPMHMKSQNRLNEAILEQQIPSEGEEWQQHDIIRIYGTSGSYENGMRKLQAAEETSNVDTDCNNTDSQKRAKIKRRERARRHFSSSDESESDTERCSMLPPFPIAKLKQSEGYSSPTSPLSNVQKQAPVCSLMMPVWE